VFRHLVGFSGIEHPGSCYPLRIIWTLFDSVPKMKNLVKEKFSKYYNIYNFLIFIHFSNTP